MPAQQLQTAYHSSSWHLKKFSHKWTINICWCYTCTPGCAAVQKLYKHNPSALERAHKHQREKTETRFYSEETFFPSPAPVANPSVLILKEDLWMISLRTETGSLVEMVVLEHFMVLLAIPLQASPSLFGVNCLPFPVSRGDHEPYHIPHANSLTPSS